MATEGIFSHLHIQSCDSLKLALVRVFTSWKLKKNANPVLFFLKSQLLNIYQHANKQILPQLSKYLRGSWKMRLNFMSNGLESPSLDS